MNNNPQLRKYQRRERKLRASYRKRMVIVFILALILGVLLGWIANDRLGSADDPVSAPTATDLVTATPAPTWFDETTEEPTQEPTEEPTTEPTAAPTAEPTVKATAEPTVEATAEPTSEPTAEPTVEATAEPTSEPTSTPEPAVQTGDRESPVPMGEAYSFTMELLEDGTPRKSLADADYFSVPVTITLSRHIDNAYYIDTYASTYMLKGNEAGCELVVTLGSCEGLNEVIMQNAIEVVLQNDLGEVQAGYQFTNAEISGQTDSLIATGTTATIYKRYNYGEIDDLCYLTVSYYQNGEKHTVYFSLEEPEPEATPEPESEVEADASANTSAPADESYTIGSTGDGVTQLQAKLIKLGYLSGKPDGAFGQWTAAAVKQAQKDFGLEQTGVADAAFLEILYSK